ncbi:MAG TPA: FGGY family carbohydrate kinase [Streptosporangiaceae bacterium]
MSTAHALLAGVDVGTTRIKAGLVDLAGHECGHASVPTRWRRLATGAEADPDDFLHSVRQVLAELLAAAPPGEIVGVGVTSMAETAILLDSGGRAIGPAVAWFDQRAAAEHRQFQAELSAAEIGRRTGLTPGQIPTIATLRWLVGQYPALRQASRALTVAEWVVYGLGGAAAAEASLASRTGALSVTQREWWPDAVRWAGLAGSVFPEIRAAGASWGQASGTGSGLGRLTGATLTVAGHDHVVASVGSGVTNRRQATDSCGTAEALIRPLVAAPGTDPAAGIPDGISTGWHVLPGHYCLLSGLRLGIDFIPLLEQLGAPAAHGRTRLDEPVLALLDAGGAAAGLPAAAREWHAALTASVRRVAQSLDRLQRLGGPITEVRISGGWAANPVLRRLKAACFPSPVYPDIAEAGIRGAALLAGLAAGVYPAASAFPPPPLSLHDTGPSGTGHFHER